MQLQEARSLIQAAQARAVELGILVAVCIVDAGGHTVAFERMDDSQLASSRISEGKAYTALAWQRPSGDLFAIAQPGVGGFGLNTIDSRFVLSPGGLPIRRDGALDGGIGVSGGTGEQDEDCAATALRRAA